MTIEPMRPADLPAVRVLLRESKLPVEGLDAHVNTAIVAREGNRIVGSAALEMYPPFALLRSVAVDRTHRGQGLGQLLTSEAIALARRERIDCIYLLTETASQFFQKLGFVAISRAQVPTEVQQSIEFTSLCPASAQVMMHRLRTVKAPDRLDNPQETT